MALLSPIVTALHGEGRLRIWSLVVTAFGDCVQHRGGAITSAQMQMLLEPLGVDPGAVRTALSRLVTDGWLERKGMARQGRYLLTPKGAAEFLGATTRIYKGPTDPQPSEFRVALGATVPINQGLKLTDSAWLVPAGGVRHDDCSFDISGATASPSFRAQLMDGQQRDALAALAADLAALEEFSGSPRDAAAARIALIHRWRRYILRHPEWPGWLMADDVPLRQPRAAVAGIYRSLLQPAEAHLDAIGLPKADAAILNHRFT